MSTLTQTKPTPGQAIPLPAAFPVQWRQPADAKLYWTHDPMHFPNQVKPLVASILLPLTAHSFNLAAEQLDLPIRQQALLANTYLYSAVMPVGLPPEPVLKLMKGISKVAPGFVKNLETKAIAGAEKKYLTKLDQIVARLDAYWATELLPEVKANITTMENFDLAGAPMPELLAHLTERTQLSDRMGEIHFLIVVPLLYAINRFYELYQDLFPGSGKFDALRLLQGMMNKSVEAGNELWDLSQSALASPEVLAILSTLPTAQVMAALQESVPGRIFLAEIHHFLQEFGKRSDTFDVIGEPSWLEDPTPVIKNLQDYITQPERNIEAEQQHLAAEAEHALAAVRTKLKGYPQAVRTQFEAALQAARVGNVLQEDHNYWLDQRGMWQMRAIFLEFGRRFAAAGVIEQALDVFYLDLAELQETAQQMPALPRQGLVAARKAEYARFATLQPPPAIGTLPAGAPPNDAMSRTMTNFFGMNAPEAASTGNELHGLAGSPGKVRGLAKVVHSLAEAGKLKKGDILVAETTAPPWTPLFATAAAIVTNTGGILSHCAIVAREYNIPAAVGVRNATTRLADGMLVEVDGDAGTVIILE